MAGKTVSVGCRYPNGLILELNDKKVLIHGANAARVIGGHGITENVDAEFMEAWLKKNAKLQIVLGGHLFIHAETKSVEAEATEKADHVTGLEALDPSKKPATIQDADKE